MRKPQLFTCHSEAVTVLMGHFPGPLSGACVLALPNAFRTGPARIHAVSNRAPTNTCVWARKWLSTSGPFTLFGNFGSNHESRHFLRRFRDTFARRDRIPPQTDGTRRRAPDSLAHHETLRPFR